MADQAANQPQAMGPTGAVLRLHQTSLSTIIGTKDWCNEDKMWACT